MSKVNASEQLQAESILRETHGAIIMLMATHKWYWMRREMQENVQFRDYVRFGITNVWQSTFQSKWLRVGVQMRFGEGGADQNHLIIRPKKWDLCFQGKRRRKKNGLSFLLAGVDNSVKLLKESKEIKETEYMTMKIFFGIQESNDSWWDFLVWRQYQCFSKIYFSQELHHWGFLIITFWLDFLFMALTSLMSNLLWQKH